MKWILALLLIAAPVEAQQAPSWHIAWAVGSSEVQNGCYWIRVSAEGMRFENRNHKLLLSIPVGQVTKVLYTETSFSRADQLMGGKNSNGALSGCTGQGCEGLLLYGLAVQVFRPLRGRSHYLRIDWSDRGVEQQIGFEIDKENYQALLATVKTAVGARYLDVDADSDRLRDELAKKAANAVPLKLERASQLGGRDFDAGEYKWLAVDRGGGEFDIYIFAVQANQNLDPAGLKVIVRAKQDGEMAQPLEYAVGTSRVVRLGSPQGSYRLAASE